MKNIILLLTLLFASIVQAQVASQGQLNYQPPANLVQNAGFERGQTKWTSSGGSVAVVTSGANLLFDKASLTFDASAASQNIQTALYTVPVGLQGTNCSASIFYKGGDTNLTLQALDGSSNVLGSQVLSAATYTTKVSASFPCPTSGTIRLRIASTADAAIAAFDNASIGAADNLFQVAEAKLMGGIRYAGVTNCNWGVANTGGWIDFASDTDCTGRVLYGAATGPADSVGNRTPSVTFANLPAGNYQVVVTGNILMSNTSGSNQFNGVRISDGTLTSSQAAANLPTADTTRLTVQNVVWNVEYTTAQTNKTFKVQGNASTNGSVDVQTLNSAQDFEIKVYRYPLQAETALRVDTVAASWSGYHDNTCSWSSASTSYVTPAADGSCGFTERTNTNFGTVSSTGAKTPGIAFTPVKAGKYKVCVNTFTVNDTVNEYTRLRLYDGTNTVAEALTRAPIASQGVPTALCGILAVTSISTVNLNLQVRASAGTGIYGAYDGANSAIEWSIFAIDQQIPAPLLIGSVVSGAAGVEKLERVAVTTTCNSGTCTIASQSGSWVTSITRDTTGDYNLNMSAGAFSSAPVCFCSIQNNTAAMCYGFDNPSTTLWQFRTLTSGGTSIDAQFSLLCTGPK